MICEVLKCRQQSILIYAAFENNKEVLICDKHWSKHCDDSKWNLKEYFQKLWQKKLRSENG